MKASILAVGTELTTGQITNANATWISQKLKAMGLLTSLHLTVPDDRDLIRKGLKLCAEHGELVFVTGGLGPTSDDFTRDLITEWAGQSLKFDEPSWQKVVDRLTSRGFPVHDFQKQQCFFPENSQILDNSQGTANAFYLSSPKHLWALPGPPREIEAVWSDHIQGQIQKLSEKVDAHMTKSWDLLGLGENQVAKIAEPIVENSGLEVGYRVHLPYVELKLSFFKSQTDFAQKYVEALEKALAPYCIVRDGEDIAQIFCAKLQTITHIHIHDLVTEGFLLKRMQPYLKNLLKRPAFNYTQSKNLKPEQPLNFVEAESVDEFNCRVRVYKDGHKQEVQIEAPFKAPNMSERRKQYFAERILIEATKLWSKQ